MDAAQGEDVKELYAVSDISYLIVSPATYPQPTYALA